ncbi:hypothetical protein Bca4012_010446 [Brassica carinata]
MSSRSSKRTSSSHSSSDDSPAHVMLNPKQEELVDEEAKNAYYRALVGSTRPLPDVPVPKRPLRLPGAPFTPSLVSRKYLRILRDQLTVPALESWLGVLIASYELGIDLSPADFEGLWSTRPTGSDGYYTMVPKKDMTIIQGTTSNPKSWQERFFYVRIDGDSVEESCLHLFPHAWNFNRGNMTKTCCLFHHSGSASF